jgi:hypothetical protein
VNPDGGVGDQIDADYVGNNARSDCACVYLAHSFLDLSLQTPYHLPSIAYSLFLFLFFWGLQKRARENFLESITRSRDRTLHYSTRSLATAVNRR